MPDEHHASQPREMRETREDDVTALINASSILEFLHALVEVSHAKARLRAAHSREAENWTWLAKELTRLEGQVQHLTMGINGQDKGKPKGGKKRPR